MRLRKKLADKWYNIKQDGSWEEINEKKSSPSLEEFMIDETIESCQKIDEIMWDLMGTLGELNDNQEVNDLFTKYFGEGMLIQDVLGSFKLFANDLSNIKNKK